MGSVFKQRYKRKNGQTGESRKWYGEYRDKDGKLRRVPLSTDKQASQAMLTDLIRTTAKIKAGLVDEFADTRESPVEQYVKAYLADLALRGRSERHREDTERLLRTTLEACGFKTLRDFHPDKLDAFLATMPNRHTKDGKPASARTRSTYRQAIVGFGNYLVRKGKLEYNRLARSTKPGGDVKLKRRALPASELRKLFAVAAKRPLVEALTVRRGPHKGKPVKNLRPGTTEAAERLGRERVLIYKTAFYTGFRRKELRSLLVGDFTLTGSPRVFLPKERCKGKRDALLPLRADFAKELRTWIMDNGLAPADPIFRVPRDTAKILRRDLKAAGIPERDERGRVFDFHALRKCLATHLNAAGVPIVTAKEFLRHSTVELTAGVYNDEEMHDLRKAAEGLPAL